MRAPRERFDVAVVGAGPAGSTAAYRLAAAGERVVLLDGARFPRDKPCGGGLTMRGVALLPFDVSPVIEDRIDRIRIRLRYERDFERAFARPLALMTQRRRLDMFLVEKATEVGVDFRDAQRVTVIDCRPDRVRIAVGGTTLEAGVVLGADGANGVCARELGLGADRAFAVALEGNLPLDDAGARENRGRVTLEVGVVPGGYGWVFPKAEHVNLGVGGWMGEGPLLRRHLARLCASHGLRPEDLSEVRGHRLPMRRAWGRVAAGRAAVIGDAAGLVDPLSGDGMFEAFLSAKLAAEAAGELLAGRAATLEPYGDRLRSSLATHAATAWAAKAMLERMPGTTWQVLRSPPARLLLSARLRGTGPAMPVPFADGLERAARRAVEPGTGGGGSSPQTPPGGLGAAQAQVHPLAMSASSTARPCRRR